MNMKNNSLQTLPAPSKGRGGVFKLGMVTLITIAITGSGVYWLTRNEEDKKILAAVVKENVETVVKDTPLETVVGAYIRSKESQEPSVNSPVTEPGTLAGQVVQGQMSAPPTMEQKIQGVRPQNTTSSLSLQNFVPATEKTTEQSASTAKAGESVRVAGTMPVAQTGSAPLTSTQLATAPASSTATITPIAPQVTQDTKVPRSFVDDVATWFVQRYNPKSGVNFNLSSINLRYGQKMHGLLPEGKNDIHGARAELLRYAFNSSMMTALYNLYVPHFVESMKSAAGELQKGDNVAPEQVLKAYANEFDVLGSVLQGIGSLADFPKYMAKIEKTVEDSLTIHAELTEAVFAFDAAVEAQNKTAAQTIQLRIDGLNAQYQKSIHDRTLAREALISAVRRQSSAANTIDADSILYLSQWLERRMGQNKDTAGLLQSAVTAGRLLQDLSSKLAKASETPQEPLSTATSATESKKPEGNASNSEASEKPQS